MSRDGPASSMFRPAGGVDQSALTANAELVDRVQRRGGLKGP